MMFEIIFLAVMLTVVQFLLSLSIYGLASAGSDEYDRRHAKIAARGVILAPFALVILPAVALYIGVRGIPGVIAFVRYDLPVELRAFASAVAGK